MLLLIPYRVKQVGSLHDLPENKNVSFIAFCIVYSKKNSHSGREKFPQKTSKPLINRGFEARNNVSLLHMFLVVTVGLEPTTPSM